jgi:ankyrin repeat protein
MSMSDSDFDSDDSPRAGKKMTLKKIAGGILGLLASKHPSPVPIASVDGDPHRLCALGDKVSLNRLLQVSAESPLMNIDLDAKDSNDCTALFWAARNGNLDCVRILLEAGADIEAPGYGGLRPLHQCCNFVRENLMVELLDRGAEINATDDVGNTALHWACRRPSLAIVKILLNRGADATVANNAGATPLHDVAVNGFAPIVKLLKEKGGDINAADKKGLTPLHLAARVGFVEVAEMLLKLGADPNKKDANGKTAQDMSKIKGMKRFFAERASE